MTIRLRPSDPETCADLAFFLRRHDCHAEAVEDGTVLVELPHVFHDEQAQLELGLYIRLWEVLHGVRVGADLVERDQPASGEAISCVRSAYPMSAREEIT